MEAADYIYNVNYYNSIFYLNYIKIIKRRITKRDSKIILLTKYVVGANPNPPKNPRRALKKGNVMAINIVRAEINGMKQIRNLHIVILYS